MPAKNSITNDAIKSKPYSSSYASGWENAFLKKPQEWLDSLYPEVRIKSFNGFEDGENTTWETPMKKEEFLNRFRNCVIVCGVFLQKADQFPHLFE